MAVIRAIPTTTELARQICKTVGVSLEECAAITICLLPMDPIRVTLDMVGSKELERIDWGTMLEGALVEKPKRAE